MSINSSRGRVAIGLGPATVVALLIVAATAFGAPDRSAELSRVTPSFEWEGGPVTGAAGLFGINNDETLVNLAEFGDLTIKLTDFRSPAASADFDLDLFYADANGNAFGTALGSSYTTSGESEMLTVRNLEPNRYVIRAVGYVTVEGTFRGEATLSPTPLPAPPVVAGGSGVDRTPDAAIGRVASRPRSFSGTAADDRGVEKVEIALRLKSGGKCREMTSRGRFVRQATCEAPTQWLLARGTSRWSFKLASRLKRGRYTLFARATDSAGQRQAGFSSANRRTFRVT